MADKCIGRLTLDTKQIDEAVKNVNDKLKELGVGIKVDLSNKVSSEVKKQLDSVLKEIEKYETKMSEAVDKAINNAESKTTKKVDDKNLKEAIALWKEYYNLMTKAQNASNAGRNNQADYYEKEANALVKDVQALRERAENTETVTRAMRSYNAAVEAGADKRAANDAKAAAQAQKDLAREIENSVKARQRATEIANAQALQDEANVIEALIELYRRKAQMDTEATKSVAAGNVNNANLYLQEEQAIQKTIDTIAKLYPELDKVAQADDRVAEAELRRQAASNSAKQKAEELNYKQITEDINNYANALTAMLNEQAKFNQQVASGKLVEGTEQYTQAEEKLRHLESAAISAGQKLDQSGREAAMGMQEVQTALDNVNVSIAAINDSGQVSALTQVENAYKQLTTAIKNYNLAKKAGNEEGMASQQAEINSAMQIITSIEQIVDKLNVESSVREQIRAKIEQAKIAQDAQAKGVGSAVQATGELESQVKGLVTRYLSLMAVIRTITNLMNNMVEYVSEYSDKMNEIQMITMKTDSEVAQLAETYRNLAADMSVSSLDMADAAIYFTRQGLGAAEIEKRLRNVTMYAKAANVEFKDASEIITAVVNSMGLVEQEAEDGRDAAQRVADVFLNIGDHAATSGQEIGEAMQKAAASAGAFGVSMEWLAAYIATVSETTRQEARTIGTAFNTIIARLHQIKSTGYNQEDETKINDISKALSKIDVALMDQSGNWRDMEVILQEIAEEWDDLDGKTKSYIATTMAGVKQQNVFLALMNDMSKGVEGNSRAFELHELAMDSDGVAADKYAVYLDSVTAAQERLTIAQENFYSMLDESVIKSWYNSLAGIINYITAATESMSGLNIILPVVAGGIYLIATAVKTSLIPALTKAGSVLALLQAHPIMLTISAVVAGITALTVATNLFNSQAQKTAEAFDEANNKIAESQEKIEKYKNAQSNVSDVFDKLGGSAKLTAEDLEKYDEKLDEIAKISPVAKQVIEELKAGLIDQQEAAARLNEELERLIENEEKVSMRNLVKRYMNYQTDAPELMESAMANRGVTKGNATEAYKNAIQFGYYGNTLEEEMMTYIKSMLDYYTSGRGGNLNISDAWDKIASVIIYETFGSLNVEEALTEEVNREMEYVLSTIGKDLDPADFAIVKKRLFDALFGDDGSLSMEEYDKFSDVMSSFLNNYLFGGVDRIKEELSDIDIAEIIAESMFDPAYFGDLFKEKGEDFSRDFIDTYKQLIEDGFSEEEIKNVFMGIGQQYWDGAIGILKDRMIRAIKDQFGTDFLGEIYQNENGDKVEDSLLWDDLDYDSLKMVFDLMQSGVVSLDEVNQMMIEANGNAQTFTENLKGYGEQVGFFVEDIDDFVEPPKGMDELVKELNASTKEVQALDSAIKAIQDDPDNINYSDILGLAEAHPELLTVIGDSKALLEMLQAIRAEAGNNQRGIFKEMILGNEKTMAGSKYAESGFKTLGEYRKSLFGNDEALAAFDAEVEAWIAVLEKANEDFKENQKEEAAAAKEATKSFSEAVSEVETLDSIINKLEQEKKVDFSDIINLSTAHPEIVAVAGDIDALTEALRNLKESAKETVRLKIESAIMDSKEWMANSEFASTGYATLGEYKASLNPAAGEDLAAVDRAVKESTNNIIGLSDAMGNLEESNTEAAKSFDATIDEIENINTALDKLEAGKKMDFSDLIDLSTAHPEILGAINDIKTLKEVLASIRAEDTAAVLDEIYSKILGDDIKNSPFKDMASDTIKTLNDYKKTLQEGTPEFEAVSAYLEQCAMNLFAASDYLNQLDPATIQRWQDMFFGGGNVDLNNRKTIDARKLTEAGWEGAGDGIATIFSKTYSAGGEGADIHWNQNVVFDVTPITPDGKVLTPDELEAYMAELFEKSANMDELMANDAAGKGILIKIRTLLDDESFEAAMDNESKQMDLLHMLQEALYGVNEAEQTWLQTQAQQTQSDAEANWAESNGYIQQITGLQQALEEGGPEAALATFNSYLEQNEDLVEGLADTYPLLVQRLAEVEAAQDAYNEVLKDHDENSEEAQEAMAKLQKATQAFGGELNKTQKYLSTKHFKNTADAIKELGEGTISATDAYDTFVAECDKVTKAQEDVNDVTQKLSKNTDVTVSDVSNLADVLGMSADQILSDWPAAVAEFNDLISAGGELESVFNALNEAAFIKITGVSEADFSNLENGLFAVNADAQALIELLQATGQWEVVPMDLPQNAKVWNPDGLGGGFWSTVSAVGKATVLKPTNNNPFKSSSSTGTTTSGSSGSSGGGGGGSSSSSGSTEVEKMLNLMQQVQDIQDNQKSYYQAQRSYYSQTGQLQGVIAYAQKEKEVLEDQNATLQDNIDNIEEYMRAKSEELASLSTSDESYEEVADDLDKLQDAHADYTEQIIENKTAIEELNDTIDETNDTIRQMEIDLRDLIYGAIEDREEKRKNMLENEIEMENIIIDLLKKRYEIERDDILDATNERIDALQKERDLLDEQLAARKAQAEAEDKVAKLKELEVKYQRIIADPTRAKEAKQIKGEIDELRKEMAWDLAEEEVKAQQDSIDQQITSLEDYIEYVENYYNDLFEHPQKLIDEMREIITGTQEEILNWLKENDEEYQNSTENTQQSMVESWTETYNDMKGIITTYWDEVEEIIAQGDEYIIEFLKDNSADYAAAGKLQAEAYVDEWMEQLENLKKAYEEVATVAAASYETIEESTYSGNNGGSNNGGSSTVSSVLGNISLGSAILSGVKSGVGATGSYANSSSKNSGYTTDANRYSSKVTKYASGGVASTTGIAWLDGSLQEPERVLSPYQTKLFDSMVEALQNIDKIAIPGMSNLGNIQSTGSNPVSVGDIIVNVDNLDTDDDYEELAQKVSEVLMDRIGKTSVIGGLRIRSI